MKKTFSILLLGITLFSCKKSYFDINDNPNDPTSSSVTSDLILPGALATTGNIVTGATYSRGFNLGTTTTRFSVLGRWLGIWSPGTNFAASDESKYIVGTNTTGGAWRNHYDNINDYQIMQEKAQNAGQNYYVGIAKIMKALNYHYLVDQFNNIPYTQAVNQLIIQPTYDRGDSIYAKIMIEITDGINLIKGADLANNLNIGSADIMFKGNKTKWARFGNTLKLRLLIHQSKVPSIAAYAAAQIAIITAEGSGFLAPSENATVNPGYSPANENPYWTTHMFGRGCTVSPDNFNRANNFSLNTMKTLNDIRYQYFYLPIRGIPAAEFLVTTDPVRWKGIDYAPLNSDTAFLAARLSDIGGARTCSPSPAQQVGLGKSPSMDSWIILSFESLFLQAEAAVLGWTSGNAQSLYNSGVTESFKWLNVTNATATATNYLTGGDSKIAWPAGAPAQQTVIGWQKYFAFNGNNHNEIYVDYRRLDYTLPLSTDPGRGNNPIPVRLPYPETEYQLNAANVNAQGNINIFTSKIFWDL